MVVITEDKVTKYAYEEANKSVIEWAVDENIVEPKVLNELHDVYEKASHFDVSQDLVRKALDVVENQYQYGKLGIDEYNQIIGVLQHAEI